MACLPNEVATDLGCLPDDPIGFITTFYGIGLGVIGLVGILFLIIGGYNLVLSRGDPSKVNIGKSYILYSIIGMLLAVFGLLFMNLIANDILHVPGFD